MENKKKPPFKKIDLGFILDRACGNPENFEEYQEWQKKVVLTPKDEVPEPFRGYNRYRITLHCLDIIVVARKHPDNNGWQIKDFIVEDH